MGYSMEEDLVDKAGAYLTALRLTDKEKLNTNQRVILRLSKEMLIIWNDWRSDTRYYRPTQSNYKWYMELMEVGEAMLDPELPDYEKAVLFIKDYRLFISLVVEYRMRSKGDCRVY